MDYLASSLYKDFSPQNNYSNKKAEYSNNPIPIIRVWQDYLTKFGYLVRKDPRQGQIMSQADLVQSICSLQQFAGINETCKLDQATISLMGTPRCGMPDKSPADKARRKRRYTLHGTYWRKKDITYRIKGYTSDITVADQHRIYKWAFEQWNKASKITVTEAPRDIPDDKVDILIDWKRGYHGDGYPFDGPGGTLAHAFYPHNNKGIAGDAHFDDGERYTTRRSDGVNLDWVALHEFGHSLGLDHSSVRGSIMFPWYQGYRKDIKLTADDIMGIQAIYGKPSGGGEPTEIPKGTGPVPTRNPHVDECRLSKYDAWLYDDQDDKTYAFAGEYYFIVNPHTVGVMEGPLKIADKWKHVRTPVSAVYKRADRSIVFFSGG
ncbi:hypothetical protein QZH41_006424 [Actinostola sp. cb2023]|nr:hypothetical protein QZH41_006424 [Actinostola sp. cb2023]